MTRPDNRRSMLEAFRDFLHRIARRKSQPPGDPHADRLVPVQRGPKGRSGTAAVAEPEEEFRSFPPRKG